MKICLPECWLAFVFSRILPIVIKWGLVSGRGVVYFLSLLFFPEGETACAVTKVATSVKAVTLPEDGH